MIRSFSVSIIIFFSLFTVVHCNITDTLLTANEIRWLDKNRYNIRFAPDPNWVPVDYIDSSGKHSGIVAELVKLIENRLDITFNILYFEKWEAGLTGMKEKEVDVMGSVQKIDEREEFLDFTDPYMNIPIVILVNNNFSDNLESKSIRIGCMKNSHYKKFIKETYPKAEIFEYSDDLTGLIQTSIGNIDGVIIDLISASSLVEEYKLSNLSIGKILDYSWDLRFAIRKDLPELSSIIQKTLASIGENEKNRIIGNYVNIAVLKSENFYSRYNKYFIYTAIILLFVSILILAVNYSLKRKVALKTAELKNEINQKNSALEKAKESDRLKTAFLNNLSHEIRTPMNAIVGFSTLLRDNEITKEQIDKYTSIIDSSASQLLNLVDDILEMSIIDSKQIKITRKNTNLQSLLDTLYVKFKNVAETKNITLKFKIPEPGVKYLITDKPKFIRVVSILLDNALKFTHNGEVVFGYEVHGDYIEFFVKDDGIGIPSEIHDKVFDRFFKVDTTDNQIYGGSGLGLSIAKEFIELLGGKIHFKSSEKQGTTFYFTIPLNSLPSIDIANKKISAKNNQLIKEFDFSNITILVVEDDQLNQLYFSEILNQTNAKVIIASNGKEAIDSLNTYPDIKIVLLDIKMPEMDGFKTAQEIIKMFPNIPLIAQTAYSQEFEKETVIKAGFDEYISKPVDINKLLSLIKSNLMSRSFH